MEPSELARREFDEKYEKIFGEFDSRLKVKVATVSGAAGPFKDRRLWEPVFCFNCGKAGGHVTAGTPIRWICQLCHEKFGSLPLPMIPGTENL